MFPLGGIPFEALPPEMQESMKRQQAIAEMTQDEMYHGFENFMTSLDEEQSLRLLQMLHTMGHLPEAAMAHYWEGIITGIRLQKFGICTYHGVNHIKDMQEDLDPQPMVTPDVTSGKWAMATGEQITQSSFSEEDRRNFEKYHIDDLYDEDTKAFIGFVCTGIEGMQGPCGMRYPSFEDRIMNEPEYCSGCFRKMAQG